MPLSFGDIVANTYDSIVRSTSNPSNRFVDNAFWTLINSDSRDMRKLTKWTIQDGLSLVRAIQEDCKKFNYHVTIGGGVVNKGESDKDVDLFFLPMESRGKTDPAGLIDYLISLWGTDTKGIPNYDGVDGNESIYEAKMKFFRNAGNGEYDRIDVFISK